MPDKTKPAYAGAFPLAVSSVLILLLILSVFIGLHLQTRLFLSSFDHAVYYILLGLVILFCVLWLLMLVFESFGLSFRWLSLYLKWNLFFIFYPLSLLAVLFRLSKKEALQASFLQFQNGLFFQAGKFKANPEVLILLPHCLQYHDCKIRITRDILDCGECGKCCICDLKQLGERYQIRIGIANGGTLARKIVHDSRPDIILAVACHRDLAEGVRETWKYPVYAILNERPNGPCFDTTVDVEEIESVIKSFTTEHTE